LLRKQLLTPLKSYFLIESGSYWLCRFICI